MAAGGHLEFLKTLNSENRSSCQKLILRHSITRIKYKKTISVGNGFRQKRPNFPQTTNPSCEQKPSDFAPKIKILASPTHSNLEFRNRYNRDVKEVTIERLHRDHVNKGIEILPNKPPLLSGKAIPALDAQFIKYIVRSKTHQN